MAGSRSAQGDDSYLAGSKSGHADVGGEEEGSSRQGALEKSAAKEHSSTDAEAQLARFMRRPKARKEPNVE
jgi:hypothetical protein